MSKEDVGISERKGVETEAFEDELGKGDTLKRLSGRTGHLGPRPWRAATVASQE